MTLLAGMVTTARAGFVTVATNLDVNAQAMINGGSPVVNSVSSRSQWS
jgi:hypothetical protein